MAKIPPYPHREKKPVWIMATIIDLSPPEKQQKTAGMQTPALPDPPYTAFSVAFPSDLCYTVPKRFSPHQPPTIQKEQYRP
jgi:hypothetical protein